MNEKTELLEYLIEKKRRECSQSLIEFTRYKMINDKVQFVHNFHHDIIVDALDKVRRGEIQNLIINVAPRYTKTELAVKNFIAQSLAINPAAKFIHLSYSFELAQGNSGEIKDIINSDWYQELYPDVKIKNDQRSKKAWFTTQGGGVYANTASGQITGFGAGALTPSGLFDGAIIIDDPNKPMDAGQIEMYKVNKRFTDTVLSRRNSKHTPIIVIMQRIHEIDLCGYIMDSDLKDTFTVIELPVIYQGKPLWEFKHDMDAIEGLKRQDIRVFNSQYMQKPTPDDGVFFKRDWFHRIDEKQIPDTLVKYGASDFAVTEKKVGKDPDFTELGIAGFDRNDNLFFVDWWSGQTETLTWVKQQQAMVKRHDPVLWVSETGVIKNSMQPIIRNFMKKEGNKYFRYEWIHSSRDKEANARAFQALAENGKVYIPKTPWGDELIEQLVAFPYAKHDDKVDTCGLFGRILDQTYAPQSYFTVKQKYIDDYDEKSYNDTDEDWLL